MTRPPVMQFNDVSRTFQTASGPVPVLRHVNISIFSGDFLVVTGPSGSGKSTFLHLCGLIDLPTEGSIVIEDADVSSLTEKELCDVRKHKVGIVFQRFCLLPHRSVHDNIEFRFRYIDPPPSDAQKLVDQRIRQMGLEKVAERKARLLSAGEQQRTAIARAVVQQPLLLLADEPTGNLDKRSAETVMQCFRELNRKGLTVVMVTHNEALLRHATRHVICENGTLDEKDI